MSTPQQYARLSMPRPQVYWFPATTNVSGTGVCTAIGVVAGFGDTRPVAEPTPQQYVVPEIPIAQTWSAPAATCENGSGAVTGAGVRTLLGPVIPSRAPMLLPQQNRSPALVSPHDAVLSA